jgi:hypothetical protein
MKALNLYAIAALAACLMAPNSGCAQSGAPPVPTTRILAIGTVNPGVDLAAVRAILPVEVRETVKLYLDGKIDQWFSLQGAQRRRFHSERHRHRGCPRHARKNCLWARHT